MKIEIPRDNRSTNKGGVYFLSNYGLLTFCIFHFYIYAQKPSYLTVTSCSVELTISRLKIIKKMLRSTTSDESLDGLRIIASEFDVFCIISTDLIKFIENFVINTEILKKRLLPIDGKVITKFKNLL